MCEFCEARKREIENGYDVTCQIFSVDKDSLLKHTFLLSVLNYCPICGRDLRKNDEMTLPPLEIYRKIKCYCEKYGVKFDKRALNFQLMLELLDAMEGKNV